MPVPRPAAASVTVPVAVQAVVPATVRRAVVRRRASAVAVAVVVAARAVVAARPDPLAERTLKRATHCVALFFVAAVYQL